MLVLTKRTTWYHNPRHITNLHHRETYLLELFNKQSQRGLTQDSKRTHLTIRILFAYFLPHPDTYLRPCNFVLDLNSLVTVGGTEEIFKCSPSLIKLPYSNKEMHKLGDFLFSSGMQYVHHLK
jgi:hypothetical protein